MSEVIRSPWILDYLISVAETYGGDLASVPRSEKRRKAQFVKFLTFPPADSIEPCTIWIDVSDEKYLVHARLSRDAMQRYMENPSNMGSVTALRSALVRLGRFRPAFARVARRDTGGGMTEKPRLYLDVDEFDLLGSFGEPMWGSPVDIAQDANIREWMEGLRQDGGAGNVLKLKKERMASLAAQKALQLQAETHHQTTIDSAELKVRVARKSAAHKARPSSEAVRQPPIASREAVRKASWRRLHTNMMKYFRPPDDIYAQLMQLSGLTRDNGRAQSPVQHRAVQSRSDSQDIKRPQSRTPSRAHTPARENHGSEPCTPSHWSPSVISGSPKSYHGSGDSSSEAEDEQTYDDDTIDQDISMVEASMELSRDSAKVTSISMDVDAPADMQRQFSPSTSSQMPPPAQPRPHILPSSIPTLPHASSSPRRPSPTAQDRPRAQTLDDDTLPPSSFPASTYQPPSPRSSPRRVPATPAYPIPVVRRVPPPQCHVLRPDPDASGEGRVLVENSDTASPGSHRFSQSQNRSQSQSQSQNQGGESQSQTESHGTTRSGEEPAQSQAVPPSQPLSQPYSQPQRPSQLRAELEPAVSSDEQLQHGRPTALAEGAESLEDANTASQLANEEPEQPKSQQSLSYKGDSQSQENIQPATGVEQPEQGVVPPEADGHVDDADPGVNGVKGKDQSLNEEPSARGSGQPVEPDPSPMAVDTPQKSAVAASPVGDAAPAWVAIGDAEDSDDSPTEVDELLSDPLLEPHTMGSVQTPRRNKALRSDPELARAREEPGQDQATPSRRVDLDSDDERTAAMVDQSEYLAKVTKIITARSRSAASERSAAERRNGPGMTEQSPRARGPAQPTHAKETGDARSPTKVKVNAKSRSSAHDPSIWYAPTFMRTTGVSKAASTRESTGASAGKAAKVPLPAAASRLAKRKASLPLPEPSPVKKRKTDAPPSSSAATVTSSTKGRPASTVSVDIVGRQSTTALGGHSCDFIQGSSTSDHGLSRKASAAMPAPHTIPPETEHKGSRSATEPARDVKYVDLRAASRSTSRASSRASSRHSGAGVLRNSSTTTIPRRDSLADTSAFQAASSRSPDSINSGPPPPASRTISSTSLADTAKPSRSNSGATSSSGRVQAALSTARHARVESSNPAGPSRVRPTGYGLSLDPTRTPGGPPLLSWEELLDILLKTGRARHQERQKEDGGGSA